MDAAAKNRKRIIVVDTNTDVGTALVYMLEIMGHQALHLFDPRYVLTKVNEFRPHVAFLDLGLPRVDGVGLGRFLRDHYARHELRLVALSAYGDEKIRSKTTTAGFDAYLVKPVKEQDVVTILGILFDQTVR